MQDGQSDLLTANPNHLLAEDPLDSLLHPLTERQERINAGGERLNVGAAKQQLVADCLGVRGDLAQRLGEQFRSSHDDTSS